MKAQPSGVGAPTALLFELAFVDVDQSADCSRVVGIVSCASVMVDAASSTT